MSNNFSPVGQAEAIILESTGENVAVQILSLSSLVDSNTSAGIKTCTKNKKRENVIRNKYL